MKRSWLVLALLLALPGCTFPPKITMLPLPALWPTMPASVRAGCEPISEEPITDMARLYEEHTALIGQYVECDARGKAKVDWFDRVRPKQ